MIHDLMLPLLVRWSDEQECVPAEIVNVAPHLKDWTFAAYYKAFRGRHNYIVTNIESGAFVCAGTSLGDAIRRAKAMLALRTDADVKREVRRALRAVGGVWALR